MSSLWGIMIDQVKRSDTLGFQKNFFLTKVTLMKNFVICVLFETIKLPPDCSLGRLPSAEPFEQWYCFAYQLILNFSAWRKIILPSCFILLVNLCYALNTATNYTLSHFIHLQCNIKSAVRTTWKKDIEKKLKDVIRNDKKNTINPSRNAKLVD